MLTLTRALDALPDIRALEQEVVAHDGGRLKLELDYVANHSIDLALVHEEGRLVGYAGVYAFGGGDSPPEIAGMVAPDARRRGIGSSLLAALLPLAQGKRPLLVVPATTPAGQAFAEAQGATRSHSEYFLVLGQTPTTAEDPAIVLRRAVPADLPELERILAAAFGHDHGSLDLDRPDDTTYAIDHAGTTVGHVRLSARDDWGGVYGFAVDPVVQGKGIGRDVLARCCRLLRQEGRSRVTLEVETENANALRLYTSTGFVQEAGEDYWALP